MGKYNKIIITTLATLILSSCSSSSNHSNNGGDNNGDASQLQIIAPKIIYSKASSTNAYIVVNNPTKQTISHISYSLSSQIGSGENITINKSSATSCATISAHSQCNIQVIVPSEAIAGSFGINAINSSSSQSNNRKVKQQAATATQVGIEQAYYNNIVGADGISLNYYHTVIAGTPYILVNGIVASDRAGNFNNVVLVDSNNNVIPNQQRISENFSSTQGSTFSILLPVFAQSGISQTIKVQTQQVASDGSVTVVSTSVANTLTTTSGVGIVDMLPNAIYLTNSAPEQTVTFVNSGDTLVQLKSLIASNPNIEMVFNPTTLASAGITTATLKLKNLTLPATSGEITLDYNNGKNDIKITAIAEQNVNPQPNPSPSPTPSPSPVPPGPVASLIGVITPDNNFYTTTVAGTVTRVLTLTNNGNTLEDNFMLTLPANFTIGSATTNSCNVTQGSNPATISDSLSANGDSCDVTVTYTNTTATVQNTGDISIAYNYNSGNVAVPVSVGVNYKVTQSTANLILMPNSPQTYSSIVSDNSAVSSVIGYLAINIGEVPATNLSFNFAGANSDLFHDIAGTCVSGGTLSNVSGSNTCTISTQFGPAPSGSAGSKSSTFNVGYTPYTSGTSVNTSDIALSGTVTAAPSATYIDSVTANTFTGGNGTQLTPYTGNINSNCTLSVTYTNTSTNISATNFTTSNATLPSGWALTTHGCNNVNMSASGGSCIDIYTINSATAGSHDINLANVTSSWSDSSGTYTEQAIGNVGTVYTNLEAVAVPNVTLEAVDADLPMGSAYAFKATITGGSSTFTPTVLGLGDSVTSPSSCALDDANPETASCIFIIAPYSGIGEYSYWNPSIINNSLDVLEQSVAYQSTGINLSFSATNSATIFGRPSPFVMPSTANRSYAPYIYLPAVKPELAAVAGTGIAWLDEGRFVAGTLASSGACYDAYKDTLTGLEWKAELTNTTYNWVDAQNYASTLSTCGQSDWRIPTINELRSLVNYGAQPPDYTSPANWLAAQNFVGVRTDTNYWSATPFSMSGNPQAFTINFNEGNMAYGGVSAPFPVWPVRGGE